MKMTAAQDGGGTANIISQTASSASGATTSSNLSTNNNNKNCHIQYLTTLIQTHDGLEGDDKIGSTAPTITSLVSTSPAHEGATHKNITEHDTADDKSRNSLVDNYSVAISRLTICDNKEAGRAAAAVADIGTVQRKGIATMTPTTTRPAYSLTDCDNHVTSMPPHIRILPKTQSLDIVDDDRMSTKCNVINSSQTVVTGLSLSRSADLKGAIPKLQCSELIRPIYPSLNFSPYASPFSSPRTGRRRPPLRESRRVSIEHNGSFIFLNQYKLMDEIGQVSGLFSIVSNRIKLNFCLRKCDEHRN